jgi:hypothetical protein
MAALQSRWADDLAQTIRILAQLNEAGGIKQDDPTFKALVAHLDLLVEKVRELDDRVDALEQAPKP